MKTLLKYYKFTVILVLGLLIFGYFQYTFFNKAQLAGFYDVKYYVEYSPDSAFKYVSNRYEFYNRGKDKYYLKPEQVQAGHWIGKGPGLYGSNSQRFARIKGIINDSVFYLTEPIEFSGCILRVPRLDPETFTVKDKSKFRY